LLPAAVRYRDRTYWEQYLHDPARKQIRPVLNHGDLFPEHILVTDRGVSGILDWEDACYEDPVGNLAGLPTADSFADQVAEGYLAEGDPGFGTRLAFHRHATWAYPMVFGLENRDTGRVREALARYERTLPA
jgi:aminoglycoside phosphotransferase (APT) family kinase protein